MKREPGLIRPRDAAPELRKLERRLALKTGLSLGAVVMLTGCNLSDGDAFDRALFAMSRFNDQVQALLFSKDAAGRRPSPRAASPTRSASTPSMTRTMSRTSTARPGR